MRRFPAEPQWLEQLCELLRIPSVSSDPLCAGHVRSAAEWVCEYLRRIGGDAEVIETAGQPLVVGEVAASSGHANAPTVLVYGHFDVQPVGAVSAWTSPPFEPSIRGDWLYARGAADDKGNLFMLLKATEALARRGELPVNVLIACDGEEECGGTEIVDYLRQHRPRVNAAILYDGPMPAHDLPAFKIATRGLIYVECTLRTGTHDLHSGVFGGAALNAVDALVSTLQAIRHLPAALAEDGAPPTAVELADWERLPNGDDMLSTQGALPQDSAAPANFYRRTTTQLALDLHGIHGGETLLVRTIIPHSARAAFSIRTVPGQDLESISQKCVSLMKAATPVGADLDVEIRARVPASMTDPASPVIRAGLTAFERTLGCRPLLTRSGGTIPVRAALSDLMIPTIHAGFDVPSGNVHSVDERLYIPYIGAGVAAAKSFFLELSDTW